MLKDLLIETRSKKNLEKISILKKFFKTGIGEYGEFDLFIGITVPECRKIANKFKDIGLNNLSKLIKSKFHEERLIALLILINIYNKDKKYVFIDFYLKNIKYINNWDLVDLTCYKLLGDYLFNFKNSDYKILKSLSQSENMWKRRISIVSTFIFIRHNYFEPTIVISKMLILDDHHLIKKAVGWMLREVGKRDKNMLVNFLIDNIKNISNISLSYAIEKFDKTDREYFRNLKKDIYE